MSIVAIDLGTSKTSIAKLGATGTPNTIPFEDGSLSLDSAVYFEEDGSTTVGKEAVHMLQVNPDLGVRFAKRNMGREQVLCEVDGKKYVAKDIQAIILNHCKKTVEKITGEVLSEVCICVPANYNQRQREETIEAAKKAGLSVTLLAKEPTAACFGVNAHMTDGNTLVLDFGGGTFDVTVLKAIGGNVEVLNTGGERHLGGEDITTAVKEEVLEVFKREYDFTPNLTDHSLFFQDLHSKAEAAKISLTTRETAPLMLVCDDKIIKTTIQRSAIEKRILPLLEKAMKVATKTLQEAGLKPEDVRIVTVGGASLTPAFQASTETTFGKKSSSVGDPHHAVALGAATLAALNKQNNNEEVILEGGARLPRKYRLQERMSHSVGIATFKQESPTEGRNFVLLRKAAIIPGSYTKTFQTLEPGQKDVELIVLQGEHGAHQKDCLELGRAELNDISSQDVHPIEVTLEISKDDLLSAYLFDPISKKRADLKITYSNGGK